MDGWVDVDSLTLTLILILTLTLSPAALFLFPPVQVPQQGTGPCFLARPPSSLTSLSTLTFTPPSPFLFFLNTLPPRPPGCVFALSLPSFRSALLCSAHPEPARRSSHQSVTLYQVSRVLLRSQSLLLVLLPPLAFLLPIGCHHLVHSHPPHAYPTPTRAATIP